MNTAWNISNNNTNNFYKKGGPSLLKLSMTFIRGVTEPVLAPRDIKIL